MKNNYVFKENKDGKLNFVGDFDLLYENEVDPWDQSGINNQYTDYYKGSRSQLNSELKKINPPKLFEIGCGLGYTTKLIKESLPDTQVVGVDISSVAIKRAQKLFPKLNFREGDICSNNFGVGGQCDVIILNELLWYILESFSDVLKNCYSILSSNGKLIISQSFLKESQRYMPELFDGIDEFIVYLNNNIDGIFINEYVEKKIKFKFCHGLIVLRKTNE